MTLMLITFPLKVCYSIPNPTRTRFKSQHIHKRSTCRLTDREGAAKSIVFRGCRLGNWELQDGVEDVYTFFGEEGSERVVESAESPTGIMTMLTRCYSASCGEGIVCYSYTCPRKVCSLVYRR